MTRRQSAVRLTLGSPISAAGRIRDSYRVSMPTDSEWPATLAADPQALLAQLEIIRPGIDGAADLMRALGTAHTRYVITRETWAATLMLLATTSGSR